MILYDVFASRPAASIPGRLFFANDTGVTYRDNGTSWDVYSGSGAGSVTSVAMTVPSRQTVSGSPITTAGTLAVTDNTQSANTFFRGPTSGSAATPGFGAIVAADIPSGVPTSLTTTGSSGVATLIGNTLNVPNYSFASTPPGGTSGQIQYNDAGVFGGITVGGDGTLNTVSGNLTVTKTSGTPFAASATTDTTVATNITSGTLPAAQLPLGSSTAFGALKVDGTTITATAGVISAVGGGSGTVTSVATSGPITGGPITATGTIGFAGTDINSSGNVVATHLSAPLPVADGGTGTASPALVQGTNVTITGTWPNQTINASGGGGGTPGGTSGQVQFNSSGTFGGFTVSGDGTLNTSTGALAVTKTGGVAFAASATTDTTVATNITSGTLPAAQLPLATTGAFGAVKPDGSSITISGGVISAASATGTVTSVGLTLPSSIITVSGSPVTTSGTLTGALATQTANQVWAGPTSGSAATPTFRNIATVDLPSNTVIATIGIVIDGGGSVPTTGQKGYVQVPYGATITGWTMLADAIGSAQITVSKGTYSAFPTLSSIDASLPPNLTSAQKNTSTTLTSWTTSITAGDVLGFNLDSVTSCQRIILQIQVTKS